MGAGYILRAIFIELYCVELELSDNLEFKILESKKLELKVLVFQNLKFRILEFKILTI